MFYVLHKHFMTQQIGEDSLHHLQKPRTLLFYDLRRHFMIQQIGRTSLHHLPTGNEQRMRVEMNEVDLIHVRLFLLSKTRLHRHHRYR